MSETISNLSRRLIRASPNLFMTSHPKWTWSGSRDLFFLNFGDHSIFAAGKSRLFTLTRRLIVVSTSLYARWHDDSHRSRTQCGEHFEGTCTMHITLTKPSRLPGDARGMPRQRTLRRLISRTSFRQKLKTLQDLRLLHITATRTELNWTSSERVRNCELPVNSVQFGSSVQFSPVAATWTGI